MAAASARTFICIFLVVMFISASSQEDVADVWTEKERVLYGTKNEIGGRKMVPSKVTVKRVEIEGNETLPESLKTWSTENHAVAEKSGNNEKKKKKNGAVNGGNLNADYHPPRNHPPKNN
ncbi:hypothetical protein MANES_14G091400v8 [Manihot esculenta]|uniref:Uncharacterized protein n=1 Tax=Manihot esculenta TaxID=3983 RepID=A0ACB7GH22_MANES|nr:hypothetical protein MANES_14G091400v8 [Manihot esculenta]